MDDNTKGKIGGGAQEEEQSCPKKYFSRMAQAKPPLGPSSPFQVWQKTTIVDVVGSSNSKALAPNVNNKIKNHQIGSVVPNATIDDSIAKPDQEETTNPNLGINFDPSMDPKKLRRIMSNRISAQRSRLKKLRYMANLEMQAKVYEDEIAYIQPQLESYQNQKESLILENETLYHQMTALHKLTLLKDAEIEKNKAEVNMQRELYMMQQEGKLQAQMLKGNNGLEPMSHDPISNYMTNSYQVQVGPNGEETSSTNIDIPPWQSQMYHHESNFTLPNYTGSIEKNLTNNNMLNPNLSHHFP